MKQKLFHMLQELQHYKNNHNILMESYVKERLDKSFKVYEEGLEHSINFLSKKHEKSLLKRIKTIDDKYH